MKDLQVHIRASKEDREFLEKAARVFSKSTGGKENISKMIRHAVQKYAEQDVSSDEKKN